MVKFACVKSLYDKLKKGVKKDYNDAKKELDDSKEKEWIMASDYNKEGEDAAVKADKGKGAKAAVKAVAQCHHKDFVAAMKEIATGDDPKPAIGVIEFMKKIFYVTYVDDDENYKKLKMLFSSVRDNVKKTLSTTNCDIQATDMDGLNFDDFAKQVKEI